MGFVAAHHPEVIYQIYFNGNNVNKLAFYTSTSSASDPGASVIVVPEPSTYALFGIGAFGMLIMMRRKKTA